MDNFANDLRAPGFLIATVLVLGIGIGAVSLMFSTFDTVVLRPLPFDGPDELVWVWGMTEQMPENSVFSSLRRRTPEIEPVVAR